MICGCGEKAQYPAFSIDPTDKVKQSHVYELFEGYCKSEGIKHVESKKDFRHILNSSGIRIERSTRDGNQIHLFGVRLNDDGI